MDAAGRLKFEALGVAQSHVFDDLLDLFFRNAELAQRFSAEQERRFEHFADLVVDARVDQLDGGAAIEGARKHAHERELRLHMLRNPQSFVRLVDADEHGFGTARARRMQDVGARAVAEIDLEAEIRRRLDHLDIVVDDRDVDAAHQERLADDLAETAETDHQHAPAQPVGGFDAFHRQGFLRQQPVERHDGEWRQRDRDDDGGRHDRVHLGSQYPGRCPGGVKHERELAALRHQRGACQRLAVPGFQDARDRVDRAGLHQHEDHDHAGDQEKVVGDYPEVEGHSDAEEEKAEQDAAKRLDVGFELVAEHRFRQEHAGQERAHGHRQAAKLHRKRRPQHHEQGGRSHHLAGVRRRQNPEHRVEQPASGGDERRERRHRDTYPRPPIRRRGLAAVAEKRNQRQERYDRQVLQEQDRDDPLAGIRRRIAALVEQLHDDRGRREDEARSPDKGDQGRKAEDKDRDAGQRNAAHRDLRRAEPEDRPPQAPQPRRLHLQPDDEQEHHHAEFRDVKDGLGIGEQADAERADDQAGGQISENRPEAKALEDGNGDDAGRKKHDHMDEIAAVCFCRHVANSCRANGKGFRSEIARSASCSAIRRYDFVASRSGNRAPAVGRLCQRVWTEPTVLESTRFRLMPITGTISDATRTDTVTFIVSPSGSRASIAPLSDLRCSEKTALPLVTEPETMSRPSPLEPSRKVPE